MIINGSIPGDPEEVAKAMARKACVTEQPAEEQTDSEQTEEMVLTPETAKKPQKRERKTQKK